MRAVHAIVFLVTLTANGGPEPARAGDDVSAGRYRSLVRAFADEMVAHGTDRYVREHTPQFAGFLMRTNPPELPPDPVFARKGSGLDERSVVNLPNIYRSGNLAHKITLRGGDVADDAALYQLLYALSSDPAAPKFADAADKSLRWFLAHAPMHNGLLPWGEHSGWDFRRERFDYGYPFDKHHEFDSRWPLWEKFLELQPKVQPGRRTVMERYAEGLWNGSTGSLDGRFVYGRHASLLEFHRPDYGEWLGFGMFPRHGGHYVRLWSVVLATSGSPEFRQWMGSRVEKFVAALEDQVRRHGHAIYMSHTGEIKFSDTQTGPLAVDLEAAADLIARTEPKLAERMRALAVSSDDALINRQIASRPLTSFRQWRINKSRPDRREAADYFRSHFFASADELTALDVIPERALASKGRKSNQAGRIPSQYAEAIDLLLLAARFGDPAASSRYLETARRFADEAAGFVTDETSSLPKSLDRQPRLQDGTPFPHFYESYLGGDDLMLSLWRLTLELEKDRP